MDGTKPGPSDDYLALLRGEITSEEYVRRLKAKVDARLRGGCVGLTRRGRRRRPTFSKERLWFVAKRSIASRRGTETSGKEQAK